MAISTTYSTLITEQIIQEILSEGVNPSVAEITERFEDFTETNDVSKPLFVAENYHVEFEEASSVTKFNNTNNDIQRDLKVLYRHLFQTSNQAIKQFDRWRTEAKVLEGRLNDLEERITSLLLISNDTAGFFNFLQDNFNSNTKIDLENTTALVNVDKGVVGIGTSSAGATRIDLSNLTDDEVEFTVLSRNSLVSTVSSETSSTHYAITDITNFWQEKVYTNKPGPVSTELKINFTEKKEISRIDVDLHMANQNSTVQLTPLYSTDNYNWKQFPVTNYTRSVVDKTTFQFAPLTAQYVKFIMTKAGFDQVHKELYAYEFGVDEISFYNEGFATGTESVLISQTLSVADVSGKPEEFSKVVLETCEDIPDDTSISYAIAVGTDTPVALSGFTSIDPLNRKDPVNPTILDFGDLNTIVIENINVSYNSSGVLASGVNPALGYNFVTAINGATPSIETATASDTRYSFFNSNDRILDYQLSSGVRIAQGTLELWRNVNTKGSETTVRGNANGWGYDDPYYKTTVYVSNTSGYSVDFGSKSAIIDGKAKSGKVTLTQGRHLIWIHKNNWKIVDSSLVTNLNDLKGYDSLYPYNHRYIVEGFNYNTSYPSTDEQIYRGFDIVAEHFMKEVSVFDVINNVPADDYSKFARDLDVEDTGRLFGGSAASITSASTVFLLKVDEENPDFVNEDFVLRFKSVNSLFKYLRFKATLQTSDSNKTPLLNSYRIKISS